MSGLGSHNSAAYCIDWNQRLPTPSWERLRKLARCVPLVRRIIEKWSLCQTKTIQAQLQAGIRALDLRVCLIDDVVWCSHTFATIRFQSVLEQIVCADTVCRLPLTVHLRHDPEHPAFDLDPLVHRLEALGVTVFTEPLMRPYWPNVPYTHELHPLLGFQSSVCCQQGKHWGNGLFLIVTETNRNWWRLLFSSLRVASRDVPVLLQRTREVGCICNMFIDFC